MREKLLIIVPVFVVIVGITIWRANLGENASTFGPALVAGLGVLGAGVGAVAVKRRRQTRDKSREVDSVERAAADSAQASVFVDAIIGGTVLGGALIFWPAFAGAPALLGFVVLLIVDFFVRFALQKSRVGADS